MKRRSFGKKFFGKRSFKKRSFGKKKRKQRSFNSYGAGRGGIRL